MNKFRLVCFCGFGDIFDIIEPDLDRLDQEVDEALEKYVIANIDQIEIKPELGFVVEDFMCPESLDKQLVIDICNGKSMGIWIANDVDFNNELYLNWIFFKNKEDKWEVFTNKVEV